MRLVLIFILMALTIGSAFSAVPITVQVHDEATVAGDNVLMGEIAEVQGKLHDASVCTSPMPGMTRKISRDQVIIAIRRAGVPDGSIKLICPKSISITRASQTVSGHTLFECAKDALSENDTFQGKVEFQPVRLPADQCVPVGNLELRAKNGAARVRKGYNGMPVEIVIAGKVYRTVHVTVTAKILIPVLVATKSITCASELCADNTAVEDRDVTNAPDDFVTADQIPDRAIAAVAISEGAIIRKRWITKPPAIHSGDSVSVVVENGRIRVSSKGIAAQNGRIGDRIKVKLTGDASAVSGIVAAPGIVKIVIASGS